MLEGRERDGTNSNHRVTSLEQKSAAPTHSIPNPNSNDQRVNSLSSNESKSCFRLLNTAMVFFTKMQNKPEFATQSICEAWLNKLFDRYIQKVIVVLELGSFPHDDHL